MLLKRIVLALALLLLVPLYDGPALAVDSEQVSRVTAIHVIGRASIGKFDGVDYVRIHGTLEGVVTHRDDVVGFDSLPLDADGN